MGMEMLVNLSMTGGILSCDGSWRRSGRKLKKQENETWRWEGMIWMKGSRAKVMMKKTICYPMLVLNVGSLL